ncbi:MAG TPA: HAD family phosphatase [Candidatus Lokiarchaeia archaeon]|nr:HAD family phosphatase [Candidatus Lokiarchaeia archaeon]
MARLSTIDAQGSAVGTKLEKLIAKYHLKGILFDLDGTLTNTLDQHVEAFHRVFTRNGFNVERCKIQANMGRRPFDIVRDLIFGGKTDGELSQEQVEQLYQLAQEKIDEFTGLIPEHPPRMPGIPDVLVKAKQLGLKLAVVSSTTYKNVKIILDRIGVFKYLDALVTGEEVQVGKPHPEAYVKGAEKLGLPKENLIIIGDSIHDIGSAKGGGLRILAVATGKHTIAELKSKKPEIVLPNLLSLL